jgi:3-deoxy-7-phosphoheptulonate synthase
MAKAAVACDADGLMIEIHNDPANALSDGPQSLTFKKFYKLCEELHPFAQLVGRKF